MSLSSYDDLLRQVESLKAENGHLRRELHDNSTHLTKLEGEASTMKNVLSHLHTAMEEEESKAVAAVTGTTATDDNNTELNHNVYNKHAETPKAGSTDNLDQNSNSSADDLEANWNTTQQQQQQQTNLPLPPESPVFLQNDTTQPTTPDDDDQVHPAVIAPAKQTRHRGEGVYVSPRMSQADLESPEEPPESPREAPRGKKRHGNNSKELYSAIQDLDRERNSLLQEIENEDKHRKWYYDQLESLEQKIHNLPVTDNYNLQTDMTRRQLEFEITRIQEVMRENLGTAEEIAARHEARLQRIHLIEAEMLQLQHRHRQQLEEEKVVVTASRTTHTITEQSGTLQDTSSNTAPNKSNVATEVSFVEASYHELQGDLPEGTLLYNGPNGSKLVTIATQTADQLFPVETGSSSGQYDTQHGRQSANQNLSALYHGAWPIDSTGGTSEGSLTALANQDTASVMSFHSNNTSSTSFSHAAQHHLGTKVEMVYSLLSMLGTHDKDDMSRTLLAMSSSQDSCIAMRQSGCLPLLIQLLHGSDKDSGLLGNTRGSKAARARAAAALHNIVHSHPDDKRGRREARVLRLLEQIRAHCDQLRGNDSENGDDKRSNGSRPGSTGSADIDHHPGPAIAALMKLSFDEEHRHAICTLGGLQAIAELLQLDHEVNNNTLEQYNITMRRYACMALTNLTFGDGTNKALLCSMKSSMRALVAQLQSPNEDLRQVAASVLRNLSWRADLASKKTLREVGSVTALTLAAMEVSKESTMKSILSALWNLSAHCSENKADICAVEGSLAFLVSTLTYKSPSKTLSIIENGGGILRNVSSHIAVREDYRKVLRQHSCLQILLKHLRSPSLTIVSNACGTLWNLSARCLDDQKALWEMGAVSMLRNLVHSKHKMISMGSAAALKNLLSARPNLGHIEGDRLIPTNRPGLHVRKQRALEAEIDQNLAETCENLESPTGSPTETRKHDPVKHKFVLDGRVGYQSMDSDNRKLHFRGPTFTRGGSADNTPLVEHRLHSPQRGVSRSGSQDSVGSTHSDISHDRGRMHKRFSQDVLDTKITAKGDTSPRGSGSDRSNSSGHSQGGRIAKVMQEVVQHAGLENSGNTSGYNRDIMSLSSDSAHHQRSQNGNAIEQTRLQMYKSHSQSFTRSSKDSGTEHNPTMTHSADRLNLNYGARSQRMERLHINLPEPEQDEPINYSMKYPSEPQNRQQNKQIGQSSQSSAFARPVPKIQNFVGGNAAQFQMYKNSQPAQNRTGPAQAIKENKANGKSFSGYAETDLGSDDQPTNFSMRYVENEENNRPLNYSTRFNESGNGYEQQMKDSRKQKNLEPAIPSLDEDTIKTFCTEGTPLNFLSTATSMNDLSAKLDKEDNKEPVSPPQDNNKGGQFRHPDSEKMSSTGTQSTERNTGSTVILNNRKPVSAGKPSLAGEQKASPPSGPSSHPPSMYSYNDSTSTSSPSEKPKAYCTEGTPMSFSRRSSLSSLHSADAHDSGVSNKNKDVTLQNADDTGSFDNSLNADVTLKPELQDDSFQSANTSGHGKTVTFDENNQVQETPLMFSRCSSLGSLSSFDAHSVHSSVISEYSRRASEVVSPSELPDSPSDTMPSSPSHRKSPVRFAPEENQSPAKKADKSERHKAADVPVKLDTIPEGAEPPKAPEVLRPQPIFKDNLKTFADEGSPPDGNFSSATSLSALTFDDEPAIKKDPGLRRVPLGQETDPEPACNSVAPVVTLYTSKEEQRQDEQEKEYVSVNEDDNGDDNSSVSEGEEDLLAACISRAMPSKKKIKKSSSDGGIKQKSVKNDQAKIKTPNKIPSSASVGSLLHRASRLPMPAGRPVARLQGIVQKKEEFEEGHDSPRKFATEGTPLNYSRAESLSDLSMDSDDINQTMDTVVDAKTRVKKPIEVKPSQDDNSDLSSLSDDDEDLLSVAIEAAMPKNTKQKWKAPEMDRTAEGSDTKEKVKLTGFRKPVNNKPSKVHKVEPQHNIGGDSVKTYAEEGTPINFSRTTSLSDLTVPDMLDVADGASEGGMSDVKSDLKQHRLNHARLKKPSENSDNNSYDSPQVYGVEGTPATFSRNDSLSDLSCDEDEVRGDLVNKVSLSEEVKITSQPSSPKKIPAQSPKKVTIQTPVMNRLKTPSKNQRMMPSSTSTPLVKKGSSPMNCGDDHIQTYATEGTPMCFSRNSPLSSLNSDGEEDETQMKAHQPCVQHVEEHNHDGSISYKVEDTPANFSGNSSLSALSVSAESLSFDPTPSESALLEECINAAMPKSNKKKKDVQTRISPSGSSDASTKRKTPRAELFGSATMEDGKMDKAQQSKNGEGPQAEDKELAESLQDDAAPAEEERIEDLSKTKPDDSGQATVEVKQKVNNDLEEEDGSDVDPDFEDQKLMEAIHEVESKVAEFDFRTEPASEKELCLEARKLPVHLLQKTGHLGQSMLSSVGSRTLEFTSSTEADLMKESFPDMSSSLVSNVTTPDTEPLRDMTMEDGSGDTTLSSRANTTVLHFNATAIEEEPKSDDGVINDEDHVRFFLSDDRPNISAEEEKALEENANIILTELSFNRDLSSSTVDENLFIENETISLVSNDYNSDTASEVSVCWSSSSKTASEQASEASSVATLSHPSNASGLVQPKSYGKPRIVKPGSRQQQQQQKDEVPKGIRGGKKLASATVRGVSSSKQNTTASTTSPPKGVRGGTPKSKTSPGGRGSGITPPKKVIPGQKNTPGKVTGGSPGNKGIPRVASAPPATARKGGSPASKSSSSASQQNQTETPKSSPKTSPRGASASGKLTPPKAVGRGCGIPTTSIPKVGTSKGSPKGTKVVRDKSVESNPEVERPAPPIKQGTFTKDSSPTENAPKISPNTSLEATDLNGNRASEKKAVALAVGKSPSGIPRTNSPAGGKSGLPTPSGMRPREGHRTNSASPVQRVSSGSPGQRAGSGSPGARAGSGSPSQRQSPPCDSQDGTPQKGTPLKGIATKGGSRTSLNKTSSGSSLNKTGSNSSLNKSTNNNNNLRTPLKRGDSTRKSDSALPRRGSGSRETSRSATPQGRTSRSVTPTGRSTTPTKGVSPPKTGNLNGRPSTPSRKNSLNSVGSASDSIKPTTAKKPAVSKIANLWKKENVKRPEPNGNISTETTEESKTNKTNKAPKSPKTGKKFSKFGKAKKGDKKVSPTEESKELPNGGLKRSSTYDKLIPDTMEVANQAQDATTTEQPMSAPAQLTSADDSQKNMWRRTYTIPSEDQNLSDAMSTGGHSTGGQSTEDDVAPAPTKNKSKKSSLSLWRRHDNNTKKKKVPTATLR